MVDVSAISQGLQGIGSSVNTMFKERQAENRLKGLLESAQGGDALAMAELAAFAPQSANVLFDINAAQAKARKDAESDKATRLFNLAKFARSQETPELTRQVLARALRDESDPEVIADLEDTLSMDNDNMLFDLDSAIALSPDFESPEFEQAKDLTGYSFNPATGEYSISPELKQEIAQTEALAAKPDLSVKDVAAINDDLTKLTEPAREIKSSANDLIALRDSSSPAAKLAAVFKFMKALDPRSVVREDEQGQVVSVSGTIPGLINRINSMIGGGKFDDAIFKDLVDTSKSLSNSAIKSVRDESISYLNVFSELEPERRARLEERIPELFEESAPPVQPAESARKAIEIDPQGNIIND